MSQIYLLLMRILIKEYISLLIEHELEDILHAMDTALKDPTTDKLRKKPYRGDPNYLTGHCYIASEALKELLGDEWKPCNIRHEGGPHWYLQHRKTGKILDVTAGQFKIPVPYQQGIGKGFLTKEPSDRAKKLIQKVRDILEKENIETQG